MLVYFNDKFNEVHYCETKYMTFLPDRVVFEYRPDLYVSVKLTQGYYDTLLKTYKETGVYVLTPPFCSIAESFTAKQAANVLEQQIVEIARTSPIPKECDKSYKELCKLVSQGNLDSAIIVNHSEFCKQLDELYDTDTFSELYKSSQLYGVDRLLLRGI